MYILNWLAKKDLQFIKKLLSVDKALGATFRCNLTLNISGELLHTKR